MPLYEFECKCKVFEELCPVGTMSAKCPQCGQMCCKVEVSLPAPAKWNCDSATVSQGKQNLCKEKSNA